MAPAFFLGHGVNPPNPFYQRGALADSTLNSSSEHKGLELVQRGRQQQTEIRQSMQSITVAEGMGDGALTGSRPQIIQYPRQFGGQIGPELQRFSGPGMLEPQQVGVQKVPV